jgi:hypothetical protein
LSENDQYAKKIITPKSLAEKIKNPLENIGTNFPILGFTDWIS